MNEQKDHMKVSTEVMGGQVSAYIDAESYEITLFSWSGRRVDPAEIDYLIKFLQAVQMGVKAFHAVTVSPDEAQPQSSSIRDAVEEAIAEEGTSPEWTEAATELDLQSQAGDSADYLEVDDGWDRDDEWYDDHGDDWSYYGSDDDSEDDEGGDDGSDHASRDPFSGKCYCPYCNSECAPDFCNGCHSELTPPAIDTEMRSDLPDEPPY